MATDHHEFEWDHAKALSNLAKHGVSFDDAAEALAADCFALEYEDDREYGEVRMVSIARIGSRLLVVVWSTAQVATRIISARRANRKEWLEYEQRFQ